MVQQTLTVQSPLNSYRISNSLWLEELPEFPKQQDLKNVALPYPYGPEFIYS